MLSQISVHMLRHYDNIGLLIPEHVDDRFMEEIYK